MAAPASLDLDELVDHWTVLEDERVLVDAKHGATRLGFALLLKFYTRHGRFPAGASDLPDGVVEFVARQLRVAPTDLGSYEWAGRSVERHRAQIRERLGFRECTVADADQLVAWLAENVAERERRPERVRDELWPRCRHERIEPPDRPGRSVGSTRRRGECFVAGCGPAQRGVEAQDRGPPRRRRRRGRHRRRAPCGAQAGGLGRVGQAQGGSWQRELGDDAE